jgi:hypothetical protein
VIRSSAMRRLPGCRRPRFSVAICAWNIQRRSLQFRLAAALAFCLSGCATEGPPHPPRVQRPDAVQHLSVAQVGRRLNFSFQAPRRAVDGRRLTKPIEVWIFRLIRAPGTPALVAFVNSKPWIELTASTLPRYERDGAVQYAVRLTPDEFQDAVGKTFAFMVQTLTRGFRRHPFVSDPSNVASVKVTDVSAPVTDLRAYPSQNAVELKWSAPVRSLTGAAVHGVTGYRILRSTTGKPGSFTAIGTSEGTSFADPNFTFGHTYYYSVRAAFTVGKTIAQSADSAPAVLTPRDVFPPHAPKGLTGIYTGRAVELVWTPNLEPDLAGYNIYRREDSQPPQKLTTSLEPTAIYRDFTAEAGHKYLYWVTALDRSGNESAPSTAVTVEAR